MMSLAASGIQFPERVEAYLDALVQTSAEDLPAFVSLVLFGSATKGGFSGDVSDVDVIMVVPDDAPRTQRRRLAGVLSASSAGAHRASRGYGLSWFVCTRGDDGGRSRFLPAPAGTDPGAGRSVSTAPPVPAVVRICDPMPAGHPAAPPADRSGQPVSGGVVRSGLRQGDRNLSSSSSSGALRRPGCSGPTCQGVAIERGIP
jgi:hypothetical protein